jgi:hypothetical protein
MTMIMALVIVIILVKLIIDDDAGGYVGVDCYDDTVHGKENSAGYSYTCHNWFKAGTACKL